MNWDTFPTLLVMIAGACATVGVTIAVLTLRAESRRLAGRKPKKEIMPFTPPYMAVGLYARERRVAIEAPNHATIKAIFERRQRAIPKINLGSPITSGALKYGPIIANSLLLGLATNQRASFNWAAAPMCCTKETNTATTSVVSLRSMGAIRPHVYDVLISPDATPADNAGEYSFIPTKP